MFASFDGDDYIAVHNNDSNLDKASSSRSARKHQQQQQLVAAAAGAAPSKVVQAAGETPAAGAVRNGLLNSGESVVAHDMAAGGKGRPGAGVSTVAGAGAYTTPSATAAVTTAASATATAEGLWSVVKQHSRMPTALARATSKQKEAKGESWTAQQQQHQKCQQQQQQQQQEEEGGQQHGQQVIREGRGQQHGRIKSSRSSHKSPKGNEAVAVSRKGQAVVAGADSLHAEPVCYGIVNPAVEGAAGLDAMQGATAAKAGAAAAEAGTFSSLKLGISGRTSDNRNKVIIPVLTGPEVAAQGVLKDMELKGKGLLVRAESALADSPNTAAVIAAAVGSGSRGQGVGDHEASQGLVRAASGLQESPGTAAALMGSGFAVTGMFGGVALAAGRGQARARGTAAGARSSSAAVGMIGTPVQRSPGAGGVGAVGGGRCSDPSERATLGAKSLIRAESALMASPHMAVLSGGLFNGFVGGPEFGYAGVTSADPASGTEAGCGATAVTVHAVGATVNPQSYQPLVRAESELPGSPSVISTAGVTAGFERLGWGVMQMPPKSSCLGVAGGGDHSTGATAEVDRVCGCSSRRGFAAATSCDGTGATTPAAAGGGGCECVAVTICADGTAMPRGLIPPPLPPAAAVAVGHAGTETALRRAAAATGMMEISSNGWGRNGEQLPSAEAGLVIGGQCSGSGGISPKGSGPLVCSISCGGSGSDELSMSSSMVERPGACAGDGRSSSGCSNGSSGSTMAGSSLSHHVVLVAGDGGSRFAGWGGATAAAGTVAAETAGTTAGQEKEMLVGEGNATGLAVCDAVVSGTGGEGIVAAESRGLGAGSNEGSSGAGQAQYSQTALGRALAKLHQQQL